MATKWENVMNAHNNPSDDVLPALKMDLAAVEKELGPLEARIDVLQYRQKTLREAIAMKSYDLPAKEE